MISFEREANSVGKLNIVIGITAFAALLYAHYSIFPNVDIHILFKLVFWFIASLIGVMFTWQGISLLRSGGKWRILIDETGIRWSSPNEKVDKSFEVKLSEIAKVEIREEYKRGSETTDSDYLLILKNDTEINLSANSGICLTKVAEELERIGVSVEIVRV
jgi:hypothetical protein